jgi:hypothetical protein
MRKLLSEWKKFLFEEVEYQGILKTNLDGDSLTALEAIQAMLPEEGIRLSPDDLHVTLIHQSILKPFKDKLDTMTLPPVPEVVLDDEVFVRTSPGKKTWAVRLRNQDEMRAYVGEVMRLLGSPNVNPEPERVFHVSLANLTGNPRDSVR